MSEIFVVKVLNLSKYNPRKDVGKSGWVRFEVDFFDNPAFFGFTPEERLTWMYILCYAMKAGGDLEISPAHYVNAMSSHIMHTSLENGQNPPQTAHNPTVCMHILHRTLEKLKRKRMVEVRTLRGRYAYVTDGRTDGRENEIHTSESTFPNVDNSGDGETLELALEPQPDTIHWLAEMWNELRQKLPEVREVSPKRLKAIKQRIRECADRDVWADVIQRIAKSDFCNGRLPGKTWRADFDFLIAPDTRIRTLEGKYDNREGVVSTAANWDSAARKVMEALRKYGGASSDQIAMQEFLGDLYPVMCKVSGGIYGLRQLPANDFALRKVAALLRESSDSMKNPNNKEH